MSIANIVKLMMSKPGTPIPPSPMKDFTVIEEIKARLPSVRENDLPTADKIYRASELSKMCPREEVLRAVYKQRKQEKIDAKTQIIFDFGNAFNDLAQQRWLASWDILIGDWICENCKAAHLFQKKPAMCSSCMKPEMKYRELAFIDKKFSISGHPDGILEKGGRKKVLELKTCNSQIFKYITEISKAPLYHHVDQINLYMWKYKVGEGIILYLNKDQSDMAEYKIAYQSSRIEIILRKIKLAHEGIRDQQIPPREICATADCARAKKCGVKQWCFEIKPK
jgi:rubrerythrin